MVRIGWVVLAASVACGGEAGDRRRACEAYARTFAETAAVRCQRGTVADNLAAFKSAAGVGADCELVQHIRDESTLRGTCFPWLEQELDCAVLDDAQAYLAVMPEACRRQLLVRDEDGAP